MWYACWVVFVLIGLPVAYQIMAPAFGLETLTEALGLFGAGS
jgi:hypothetical protein